MIDRIDDPARFQALNAEWDELLKASSADSPFLTWEWLWSWWKHLAADGTLHILAFRDRDRLVAIAPLMSRTLRVAGLAPVRVLEFLGTGSVGSDYLDLIVRRGQEAEALEQFDISGSKIPALNLAMFHERSGWHMRRDSRTI